MPLPPPSERKYKTLEEGKYTIFLTSTKLKKFGPKETVGLLIEFECLMPDGSREGLTNLWWPWEERYRALYIIFGSEKEAWEGKPFTAWIVNEPHHKKKGQMQSQIRKVEIPKEFSEEEPEEEGDAPPPPSKKKSLAKKTKESSETGDPGPGEENDPGPEEEDKEDDVPF